jgi:hypothetical protein
VRAEGAQFDVRVHDNAIAAVDLTMRRARVCVRFFEVKSGRLWRVRNERDEIVEEYDYDGDLLVAARIGHRPVRYFEYDDRGRRARCVRTWNATGARDRMITYAGLRTVVDDATGATWIVERGTDEPSWLDPEMRRITWNETKDTSFSEVSTCRVSSDASGAIRALEHPSLGSWSVQTDALGRVIEVQDRSNRRVFFRREGEYVTVQSFRDASLETTLTYGADAEMRLYDLHRAPSGFTISARYDEDGALTLVLIGDEVAQVQNDLEGRPISVRFEDGQEQKIARDRAGSIPVGALSNFKRSDFIRKIIDPSFESILLHPRHTTTPVRFEPVLGQDSERHLRNVLLALEAVLSSRV